MVIGVDYRLAPEYPFPLPHNDCFEVLNWITNNAAEYMIDIKRLALWGCSAGGNLAAGVALRDSAENEITRLRHVNLIVPVTCHPNLYPPILQSSNSSVKHFPFGGTAEESMEGLRRIWGELSSVSQTFPNTYIEQKNLLGTSFLTRMPRYSLLSLEVIIPPSM